MATPDDTIEQDTTSNIGTSASLNDAAEARAAAGGTEEEAHDEEEDAMLAGYQATRSEEGIDTTKRTEGATDNDTLQGNTTGETDGGSGDATGDDTAQGADTVTGGESQEEEIPGLGKPSEIRAQLAAATQLQQQLANVNGRMGHLQQLVTQAQAAKGKTITKDMLKRVSNEFGDEFAESLAADLNEAGGLGGGGSTGLDEAAVNERVAQAVTNIQQATERKLVGRDHKDAADYFAGGKHHAQFVAFVQALPAERQQLVMSSWDSDVISPAIAEFKAQRDKAVNQQVRQTSRVARAVAPTQGRGAQVTQPQVDPMEAGYSRVAGTRMRPSQASGRRA